MKQKVDSAARQRTRRLILEAMADVVTETAGIGFSVQAVADRAGVTHRTVYNHFRTREALCEAFEGYVDEQLSANGVMREPTLALATLPDTVDTVYRILALRDRHVRASVMLMIGNRRPLGTWRKRTQAIEKLIAAAPARQRQVTPRQVTAAIRLFVSSMGWHLLTEQFGMTT
ncbi:MAG: TetR/AcrR family transcriptional regulator, partial [Vicinamibacterales bacterium]